MRIARLVVRNWGPFVGEHALELGPKAYAVVARRDGDAEASNGAGKTMLVEAVEFALYGRHRHRLEDDLIARGQDEAEVRLEFDGGGRVARSRQRGKATRLAFAAGDDPGAVADAAQALVLQRVGLDADDYRNTAYLAQKQAHRLVTARPEERMQIVGGWLHLDRLEACADAVRARMGAVATRRAQLEGQLAAARETAARALGTYPDEAALEAAATKAGDAVAGVRAELLELQAELAKAEAAKVARERAHELAGVREQGRQLRAAWEAADPQASAKAVEVARADLRMAAGARDEAAREVAQRRVLARGQFDGRCPLVDLACPAKDKVNALGREGQKHLHEAQLRQGVADERYASALEAERGAAARQDGARSLDARLEAMRDQARRLMGLVDPLAADEGPDDPAAVRQAISALQDRLGALAAAHGAHLRAVADLTRARTLARTLGAQAEGVEREAATHRAAAAVFGRNGAQRRVAEGALGAIEAGANAVLGDCGSALRVGVSWAREGQGLAKHCEACGRAYPASAKVKACEGCGAARGPHLVQRLEVELSDRSGGLDDLGGLALQLAAWRWLRAARGSAWGVLVLDEVTAAMDRAARRAMTGQLARMLAHAGAEQAFLVTHATEVSDALPGRILVESNGKESTVRVVA